ncbi:NAD(P)H-hydrate dehydratase [Sulfoacidibacillus thermotolerans]|uniref:Bifunctional NAD(P)H-hydrate repair enzyme n=1 Tax=Sulfoacidibacillus thermotolerans TaxID=1765684 RepID=A0A2U3D6P6_SULT2|nr:NAD(P)H-hydrate dehydratase [Sulfoacidibacillus thermotolerans]PWI56955.1 hypothetical protein BM613_11160 [Sulfoacidibacillus thermotolerans]
MLLVTSAEMQTLDELMIKKMGVPSAALMESIGLRVAQVIIDLLDGMGVHEQMGERSNATAVSSHVKRIAVVVGKGHNGADGLVAARYLHAFGYQVRVWLAAPEDELAPMTRLQFEAYLKLQGQLAAEQDDLADVDVIVDAILGNGSKLPLREPIKPLLRAIRKAERTVVAIDLPTGLDADTGQIDADCVQAAITVTCGFAKPGLYMDPGRNFVGRIVVASLALPREQAEAHGAHHYLITPDLAASRYRKRPTDSHKGTFGRVGILAGSKGMYGAARLAVEAAYRAGAGLVYYFAPTDLSAAWLTAFPVEAIIKRYPGRAGEWTKEAIDALVALFREVTTGVIGPGLGMNLRENVELLFTLANLPVTLVLDADFLSVLASLRDRGQSWFARRSFPTVITPHPKEFARLLDVSVEQVQANRLGYAKEFAVASNVVVVLKGAGTVIATPQPRIWINQTGNSGLATGGTGDVLAGMIAGLVASGYDVQDAAIVGVYVHGLAAQLACQKEQSEESLLASDLFRWLGTAFRQISRAMDISLDG